MKVDATPTRSTSTATARQKTANPAMPLSIPRSSAQRGGAALPLVGEHGEDGGEHGQRREQAADDGPSRLAAAPSETTSAAVNAIRSGSSQRGVAGPPTGARPGREPVATASASAAAPSPTSGPASTGARAVAMSAAATQPAARLARQPASQRRPCVREGEAAQGDEAEQRPTRRLRGERRAVLERRDQQDGTDDRRERADYAAEPGAPAARRDGRRRDEGGRDDQLHGPREHRPRLARYPCRPARARRRR